MQFVKKYWAEIIVFGAMFSVLLLCALPNWTWLDTDCDGAHYTYASKYLYPSHKTSAPLFLLLGRLFLFIPYGTDAWRMGLISVLASTVAAVFIYLAIRQKTQNRFFGLLGALVYGSSALVISQSTIIETYALVTMFSVMAYYFSLRKNWFAVALCLGAGGAVHHLIGITMLVLFIAHKGFRKWKYIGTMAAFLIFYIYVPLTNRPPYMWAPPSGSIGGFLRNFWSDNVSTAIMLIGGLAIWDFPKRIVDMLGQIGVSFTLGLIPLVAGLWDRKFWKEPLFWLFVIPIIYYCSDLSPQTSVYLFPSIAFGSILVGVGLKKLVDLWDSSKLMLWKAYAIAILPVLVLVSSVGMLGFNASYFDIGRSLDPDMSAMKFYNEELSKIPDGEIFVAQQGWEWAMTFVYNKYEGRSIIPICVGTLGSLTYQKQLRETYGVNVIDFPDESISDRPTEISKYIIANNDDVYTTIPTTPRTYGAMVIPVKDNGQPIQNYWAFPLEKPWLYVDDAGMPWILQDEVYKPVLTQSPKSITGGELDMHWQFKPSNPYDIMTGAIEVEQWVWINFSNYTILTMTMMALVGAIPCYVFYMLVIKKKKFRLFRKAVPNGKV